MSGGGAQVRVLHVRVGAAFSDAESGTSAPEHWIATLVKERAARVDVAARSPRSRPPPSRVHTTTAAKAAITPSAGTSQRPSRELSKVACPGTTSRSSDPAFSEECRLERCPTHPLQPSAVRGRPASGRHQIRRRRNQGVLSATGATADSRLHRGAPLGARKTVVVREPRTGDRRVTRTACPSHRRNQQKRQCCCSDPQAAFRSGSWDHA